MSSVMNANGTETKYLIPREVVDAMGLPFAEKVFVPSHAPLDTSAMRTREFLGDARGREQKADAAREGNVFFSQCVVVLQGKILDCVKVLVLTPNLSTGSTPGYPTALFTSSDPSLSPQNVLDRKVQVHPPLAAGSGFQIGYTLSHATTRYGNVHERLQYLFRVSLARANTGAFVSESSARAAEFLPYLQAMGKVRERLMDLSILSAAPELLADRYPWMDMPTDHERPE